MSPLRIVWTVARREVNARIRTRSFLISTVAILAILVGYAALMFFIGQQGATSKIGFTGQATAVAAPFKSTADRLGTTIQATQIPDQAAGEKLVSDGELDGLVAGAPDALSLIVRTAPDSAVRTALDEVVRQQALDAELAMAGIEPADVHSVLAGAHVDVRTLEPADPQRAERLGMAVGAGALLYFFLIMFGQAVAQGVVEEKTSRVVEILLSTIRPTQLLAGKVLGIGLAGLVQFVLIGGLGLAAGVGSGALALPSTALIGTMLWTLLWFLLGFYLYATVLAAAASLVSRQEDLQSVVSPVIMVLVVPFVVGVSVLPTDPESSIGAVLSLIPGFAPVLMPMRTALGVAAPWECVVSVLLSIAAIAATLRLGGRIYANAILHTGARVKLLDAVRWG
ncbi:ABC transporter permease [Saccharopolyspora gloriosae]|uniref:ABC transporter permease n=1 Tax=Saccharopolyspora gloriosae TaxID=455344 RepID=UPI001FB82321|nr:ABC transporter permease [Saccharopolyspora gloriosae]